MPLAGMEPLSPRLREGLVRSGASPNRPSHKSVGGGKAELVSVTAEKEDGGSGSAVRVVAKVRHANGETRTYSATKTTAEVCEWGAHVGLPLPSSVAHAPWVVRAPLLRRFIALVAKERGPDAVFAFVGVPREALAPRSGNSALDDPASPCVFSRQKLSPQDLEALMLGS